MRTTKRKIVYLATIFIISFQLLFSAQPKIVIIHWNDFHSNNLPYQVGREKPYYVGGYAYLAGYVDSLRKLYPEALVFDAGDEFQGSPISNFTKGRSQILILNHLGIHGFLPGNHEFDYGFQNLRELLKEAKFPVITTNLFDSSKMDLIGVPYKIYKMGKVKVGVLGIAWEDLKSSMLPSNSRGLGILDPVSQINKYIKDLRKKTDILILLSHSGAEEDSILATKISEVDLIVGAHSHTVISQPKIVNGILIVQAGSNGRYIGVLKAGVDTKKNCFTSFDYELIETRNDKIKPFAPVENIVDSLENSIKPIMEKVIGELEVDWIRNSNGESNIGNWICDALRDYFKTDIAFMNSGGIRKNLKAGPIRVRDIWEISPFDNTIYKVRVKGKQLKQMLEYRIRNPRDFLQVSGLKYVYNEKSKELISIEVNGKALQEEEDYWIAMNNFIIGQFERFFGLKTDQVFLEPTEVIGRDVLIETVTTQKVIKSSIEGRIVVIN